MAETGEVAVGLTDGDKQYQERARRALPILVRQAMARRTMFYSELATELGISNPRTLNYPLGAVGNAMLDLAKTWGRPVPPIQALVVNKSTGLAWRRHRVFCPRCRVLQGNVATGSAAHRRPYAP